MRDFLRVNAAKIADMYYRAWQQTGEKRLLDSYTLWSKLAEVDRLQKLQAKQTKQ